MAEKKQKRTTGGALTEKQKLFCELYIENFNGTRAYLKAYPKASYGTAGRHSQILLRKPAVIDYISELKKQRIEALRLSQEDIILQHWKIAFGKPGDFIKRDSEGNFCIDDSADTTAISSLSISANGCSIKMVDKKESLEYLNKLFAGQEVSEKNVIVLAEATDGE